MLVRSGERLFLEPSYLFPMKPTQLLPIPKLIRFNYTIQVNELFFSKVYVHPFNMLILG